MTNKIAGIVKARSVNNVGINIGIGDEDKWLNFQTIPGGLTVEAIKQRLGSLRAGSEIELYINTPGKFVDFMVTKEAPQKQFNPNRKFQEDPQATERIARSVAVKMAFELEIEVQGGMTVTNKDVDIIRWDYARKFTDFILTGAVPQ